MFSENELNKAMIGDSLAHKIFSQPLNQNIILFNISFSVAGVCVDPMNNGNVTYIPLKVLQNASGISGPNIVLVKFLEVNREEVIDTVRSILPSDFEFFELNEVLGRSLGFLDYVWSAIILLPFFSLISASFCLVGYVMLAITEQRQEFGIFRAVGAKPKAIVKIVSWQNLIILLSSCAVGIAFGIMTTLVILVQEPLVTIYTVIEIATIFLATLTAIFIVSLYPAIKFAKKTVLKAIV